MVWLAYQDKAFNQRKAAETTGPVHDDVCFLYDERISEIHQHLFADCQWITTVRTALASWIGASLPQKTAKHSLSRMKKISETVQGGSYSC